MTDASIFTVDLDDEAFQHFAQTFERFKAESEKIKATWKSHEKIVELATKNLERMAALRPERAPAEKAENVAEVMDKWGSSRSWSTIGSAAKALTTNARTTTLLLGKWTGITSLFGSLIAAGGIYGISRVAADVSRRRTGAVQLGSTYGGVEAAGAAFMGLPGAGSIIGGLSSATANLNGMGPLFALMGGRAGALRGSDPVEAFTTILPDLKRMADEGGSWGSMSERLRAMGLDKIGVSMETMRALRAMKPEEIQDMIAQYRAAKPRMELSEKDQKALQDFDTALTEAEVAIGNVFGANLVKLTPIVEKGAALFAKAVEVIGEDGGPVTEALEKFDKAILEFSKWIETPEFRKDVEGYLRDVADVGAGILQLVSGRASNILGGGTGGYGLLGGSTGKAVTEGSGMSGGGGQTPEAGVAVGGSQSATGSGNQPGAVTPSQHRPHAGPIPMPWTTRDSGGTTPRAAGSPRTGSPEPVTGPAASDSAVHDMMQLQGLHERDPKERQLIAQYLRSGGHGMDPAVTPWCAAAVSSALHRAGYRDLPQTGDVHGGDWADAYRQWGRHVDPSKDGVRADDVVMFDHGPGTRAYHVGLATGNRRGDKIEVMEGNTSDMGAMRWESTSNKEIRRATEREAPKRASVPEASKQQISPQIQGAQSHVEIHDNSGEGSVVSVHTTPSGPMSLGRGATPHGAAGGLTQKSAPQLSTPKKESAPAPKPDGQAVHLHDMINLGNMKRAPSAWHKVADAPGAAAASQGSTGPGGRRPAPAPPPQAAASKNPNLDFARGIYQKARAMGLDRPQAQLMAAQASLESDFGRSQLARENNNFFGMTGPGDKGVRTVHAYGKTYQQSSYSTPEAGLKHWWENQKKHWPGAATAKSLDEALDAQHHGKPMGYSETKDYAKRLHDRMKSAPGYDDEPQQAAK